MKPKLVPIVVTALAFASVFGGVVHAITNGVPDGNRHPYVAFLLFYAPDGEGNIVPQWTCSGSLISSTVVLTAGHCTSIGPGMGDATKAAVWFDSDVAAAGFPSGGIESTDVRSHPQFNWAFHVRPGIAWETVDTGVVILSQPVTDKGFARLPAPGVVDTLPTGSDIDIVGYGAQSKVQTSGPPGARWTQDLKRYYAPSQIVASENLNSDLWLKLTANPGQGKGGECFGDSGSPALRAGTNIVLATSTFANNTDCAGVTYSNRVDRAVVLDWVQSFIH